MVTGRLRKLDVGGVGSATIKERDEDDESLPSPVSIPSIPVSPMVGRGTAASAAAANAGTPAGARFGAAAALEAENGRLRAKVAHLEEQASKTREVVGEMRAEMERQRVAGVSATAAEGAASSSAASMEVSLADC